MLILLNLLAQSGLKVMSRSIDVGEGLHVVLERLLGEGLASCILPLRPFKKVVFISALDDLGSLGRHWLLRLGGNRGRLLLGLLHLDGHRRALGRMLLLLFKLLKGLDIFHGEVGQHIPI